MVGGPLWVIYVADTTLTTPHVAFAVGRATGSAVRRNRIRRQLRAALSDLDRGGALPRGLYLVGLRSALTTPTGNELRAGLHQAVMALPGSAP